MAPMTRALTLACLLLVQQAAPPPAVAPPPPVVSVLTKPCEPPVRNVQVLFYDELFLIAARTFGDRRDPATTTEPGLFVHSKSRNRWLQVVAISTAGGRLGRSWTDDPQAQRRLRNAPVGWDFTPFAGRPYIDQPLRTSGTVVFPDRIAFDEASGQYELRFYSAFGVQSAETVLYVKRADLLDAFTRR
jgi:hypothetical protein